MNGVVATRITVDCEASGAKRNKANPFDPRNKLVTAGIIVDGGDYTGLVVDRDGQPYGDKVQYLRRSFDDCETIIAFNAKYDIHWLRRYGVLSRENIRKVWCCQLAHYLLIHQSKKYPSLNDALARYGIPTKLDVVKTEYWDKGIDTDEIPLEILLEYQEDDVRKTELLYQHQVEEIKEKGLWQLLDLSIRDLITLEEMEWNGLSIDRDLSLTHSMSEKLRQEELEQNLHKLTPECKVNWSSPSQVSAVLFGGKIEVVGSEPCGVFKTGARAGQPKYRKVVTEVLFDTLVEPPEGSELAKEGQYSTDETTLRELKTKGKAKEIIETYLQYKEIDKLVGTYYEGLPKKLDENQWEDNTLHHSLNQCVVPTGRLSSSAPNLQNIHKRVKEVFVSRYE